MSSGAGAVPRLGIIGGSAFLEAVELEGARTRTVDTARGTVTLHDGGDFVFLRRHGEAGYRPPHRIPHHAHVLALEAAGVRAVAAFASAGALHNDLSPGDVLVPDDYLSWHPPPTFAADEYLHIVPVLDPHVRTLLLECARAAGPDRHRVRDGGVYVETTGPRFETRAEVRLLAQHADVVGMTAASEATLCQERGLAYAMVCIIDNWAHGVGPAPLTLAEFQAQVRRNRERADSLLRTLVRRWRSAPPAALVHDTRP